jgi:hypothetical protein
MADDAKKLLRTHLPYHTRNEGKMLQCARGSAYQMWHKVECPRSLGSRKKDG